MMMVMAAGALIGLALLVGSITVASHEDLADGGKGLLPWKYEQWQSEGDIAYYSFMTVNIAVGVAILLVILAIVIKGRRRWAESTREGRRFGPGGKFTDY